MCIWWKVKVSIHLEITTIATISTKVKEVMTTWGHFFPNKNFIMEQDPEDLVMGVICFNAVMTANNWVVAKVVDIRGFGFRRKFLSSSTKISPLRTIYLSRPTS